MSDELRHLSRAAVADALDTERDGAKAGDDPAVIGVLLAAGGSSRFGDANKLLADIDGDPLVCHAARTFREARVSPVVAVLGYESSAVRDALRGSRGNSRTLRFVTNPAYERGLSTSVRAGVDAARGMDADAAVFFPGDMPAVAPATVDLLVDVYRTGLSDAVAAGYRNRRGNPVLFGSRYFAALRSVEGDIGGRNVLLGSDRGAVVETADPGVVRDIDTRDDRERRR